VKDAPRVEERRFESSDADDKEDDEEEFSDVWVM
jgi:hypothetical protein